MKKNILDIELFESLLEFSLNAQNIDLHNEYSCVKISYKQIENSLCLLFRKDTSNCILTITFTYCEKIKYDMQFENISSLTIDNFYRGRYEENGQLIEVCNEGGYIYIEFIENVTFEFFCKELSIELIN